MTLISGHPAVIQVPLEPLKPLESDWNGIENGIGTWTVVDLPLTQLPLQDRPLGDGSCSGHPPNI